MKLEDLLTIQEATVVEGVSRKTIYDWMQGGVLAYVKRGGCRLIHPAALKGASDIMALRKKGWNLRKKNRGK